MALHAQRYRPIRGGIRIVNAKMPQNPGTLGCICIDAAGALWILSCRHVLVRPPRWEGVPFSPGEAILQPKSPIVANRVAVMGAEKSDARLDCAAALLDPGTAALPELLGFGALAAPQAPVADMKVLKSGGRTDVTEGIITRVTSQTFEVGPPAGAPSNYQVAAQGDSGAIWVERETGAPVGLLRAGETRGNLSIAKAVHIIDVLTALELQVLLP